MRRLAIMVALMTLTLAGSALAISGDTSREGVRRLLHRTHMPEPTAAVLFAVGIGISAWAVRSNSKRS